jgi:hypothetical protein
MSTDDEEMNEAVAVWDRYLSTPYAPYVPLPTFLGWTLDEYNHWLRTGEKPAGWKFENVI